MRIKIEFSTTDQLIPNNQWVVTSYFNDLLGQQNKLHGKSGNYVISHLCGGKLTEDKKHLQFIDGHQPFFLVTSNDMVFMSNVLLKLITTKPSLGYGATFKDIKHINEQFYNGLNHFFVLSPVLLKDKETGKFVNIKNKDDNGAFTVNNEEYAEKLKTNIINKFSKIDPNLDFKDFDLKIDFDGCKVFDMMYRHVVNPSSTYQITFKTNKKVAEAIYSIGLGKSTNCGFGTIYKTENHDFYKF